MRVVKLAILLTIMLLISNVFATQSLPLYIIEPYKEEVSREERIHPMVQNITYPRNYTRTIYKVRIVTGDIVYVINTSEGLKVVDIEVADPQDKNRGFTIYKAGDNLYVIPEGVSLEKYDKELFNVAYLIKNGYYNSTVFPLIIKCLNAKAASSIAETIKTSYKNNITCKLISRALVLQSIKVKNKILNEFYKKILELPSVIKVWLDKKIFVKLDVSVPKIRAPPVWAEGYNGSGVVIAILDTGIDYTHPDFFFPNGTSKIIANESFVDEPSEEVDDSFDYHGHGTHCAGIAAGTGAVSGGTYTGVAPGALLMAGKVLNKYGWGYDSWIIAGIDWAVNNGANVISMSLGGGYGDGTDPLSMECKWAVEQGVVVVVAAGNDYDYWCINCPGCAPDVITVGAVDDYDDAALFSSKGPTLGFRLKPDVVAPGVDIMSTVPYSIYGKYYDSWSGTSMATPHVAGLAALVIQKFNLSINSTTPKFVKNLIASSSLFLGEEKGTIGGCRNIIDSTYATPIYSKLYIEMDDLENNDEIYYWYEFTLVMSNGTEYVKYGESIRTYGNIREYISFDEDSDGNPDMFKRIYIYAYTSDDDTLRVYLSGWNGTEWKILYGDELRVNVLKYGAGRIDAYNATHPLLVPDPAIVDLGIRSNEGMIEYNITLKSMTTDFLNLTFALEVSSIDRPEIYANLGEHFYVKQKYLELPGMSEGNITLVLNLTGLPWIDYEGVIFIYNGSSLVSHIVFSVFKYLNLTVRKIGYDGNPESSSIMLVKNLTREHTLTYYRFYWPLWTYTDSSGKATFFLPEGLYHIASMDTHDGSIYCIAETVYLFENNKTIILDERNLYEVKLLKPANMASLEKSYSTFLPYYVEYESGYISFRKSEMGALIYYPLKDID
ncbi:MAG: hypothetical protein DRJ32_07460, partial [Thermoprotei archaeon]